MSQRCVITKFNGKISNAVTKLSIYSNSSWPNFVKYHLFCAVYLNCSVTSKVDARPDDFPVPSNPPGRSLKCVTYLTRIIYSKIE